MTDEREVQPIPEVTGEAIKARVEQFFPGIHDFITPGHAQIGLFDIEVIGDEELAHASASINGVQLACIEKGRGLAGDQKDACYTLYGVSEYYGEDRKVALWFDSFSSGQKVMCLRENNSGDMEEIIQDPAEILKIAKELGVEV